MSNSSNLELQKKFCVYIDWTKENPPRAFYVGKGTQKRIRKPYRNEIHKRIKKKYGYVRTIAFETDDEQEALSMEMQLIQEHKTKMDHEEGWWGANLTLGGTGTTGCSMSESHKKIVSESAKLRWQDPEKREKYIKSNLERWTEDEIEHHSAVAKKRWENPEERIRASQAAIERWKKPEQIESKRESTKKLWEDPEYREKQISIRIGKKRPCKKCGILGHMSITCDRRKDGS